MILRSVARVSDDSPDTHRFRLADADEAVFVPVFPDDAVFDVASTFVYEIYGF